MSEATNTKLMDTEPGGENTQYEAQATFQKNHATAHGHLENDGGATEADQQAARQKKARGEQTAENIRYGEAISEHGYGGKTTTSHDHTGGESRDEEALRDSDKQRIRQGYAAGGSGVGA